MERLRIVLAGGGTGGHVYPALAVVASAAEADENAPAEFLWVGTDDGLERGIVERHGLPFQAIDAAAIRGRSPVAAAGSVIHLARGTAQAMALLNRFRPNAVLATGGFVCVPVVLAARLVGVPSVVYLPDLRPGWAVRFLARFATAVAVSFDEVVPFIPARDIRVTGYPVRPDLFGWTQVAARARLGLSPTEPIVLVLGGSRGARSINSAIAGDIERLVRVAQVIHVTGQPNVAEIEATRDRLWPADQERYRVYPYLDADLAPSLAAATLVIARSGASVLGELPAVGAAAILVPYPHAGAHQRLNADFLAQRGAAVVVDDAAAQTGDLGQAVLDLLGDQARLSGLAAASRQLARPDAARNLYHLLGKLAFEQRELRAGWRSA